MGGGAADQVFGGGSAAVLTKWTVWGVLVFFVISFILYLMSQSGSSIPDTIPPAQGVVQPPTPAQPDGNTSSATPSLDIPLAGSDPAVPSTSPENKSDE